MAMIELRTRLAEIARGLAQGLLTEDEADTRVTELWREVAERRRAG